MKLGRVLVTANVKKLMEVDLLFDKFVVDCVRKYSNGNWGDTCEEDVKENDLALKNGERIFAVYNYTNEIRIFIITEWDRSVTTVLFPNEY